MEGTEKKPSRPSRPVSMNKFMLEESVKSLSIKPSPSMRETKNASVPQRPKLQHSHTILNKTDNTPSLSKLFASWLPEFIEDGLYISISRYEPTTVDEMMINANCYVKALNQIDSTLWLVDVNGTIGKISPIVLRKLTQNELQNYEEIHIYKKQLIFKVVKDFSSTKKDELNVKKDDHLILVQRIDNEWGMFERKLQNDNNITELGLVPLMYIEELV